MIFKRSSKGQVGGLYMDYHVFKKPKIKNGTFTNIVEPVFKTIV